MGLKEEEFLVGFIVLATAFLFINVNADVGTLYSIGAFLYLLPIVAKNRRYFIEVIKGTLGNRIFSILLFSFIGVLVWALISSYLIQKLPTFSLIDTFRFIKTQTNIPILSQDPTVRILTYGIIIPIVETFIFLSFGLLFWGKIFSYHLLWNPRDLKMWIVAGLVGITGSIFHITVRLASSSALAIDFLFFFISALLVIRFKELIQAMFFHIITNTAVLLVG